MSLKSVLKQDNIIIGYLYFYIHLITEIVCFYSLANFIGDSAFLWIVPFIYDALAFTPQSLIGYFNDKHPKISLSYLGIFLMIISLVIFPFNIGRFTSLIILCLGNACVHVNGAEVTLRTSNGHLSHSAIFVAGGSFGVIIGKILASINLSYLFIIVLALTTIPVIKLANYCTLNSKIKDCQNFNYHNPKLNAGLIIILTMFIIIIRGFMAYGIPTSWNKTLMEAVFLYFTMGIGKALGGIMSDLIGTKKTAIISCLLSLPFLLLGDNYMLISLIGVMSFSMTMAITLGLLVSVLKNTPGLVFGLTTIGLFLGTAPIFFINIPNGITNTILIIVLTLICLLFVMLTLRRDSKNV